MISLVKVIIEHFSKLLGKRGELRNKDILLTPQLSSSFRMLEFLSSCVLLLKKLVIVMPRFGTNRPGIFELGKNKIGRSLEFFATQKIGMTVLMVVFSLFLLFPNVSNSAVYFLPDAQSDEIFSSSPIASIDSVRCEEVGYTYYSSGTCPAYHNQETCVFSDKYLKCDGKGWCLDNGYTLSSCPNPKLLTTQCLNGLGYYKSCVCPTTYKYACTGTGYSSGNGTVCESKYTKCNCSTNYVWSGSACVCDSAFKYSCSGTGYSSGSGASCGGKYKSCNCSTYYSWNGSACAHVHSYVCPSGYQASSSGMIAPASKAKVCQLSGCSSTSGACYKETHSHSYSCPSGYSTSSSGMISPASTSKVCSCGAKSGTCYKETHSHSYYCPSGYSASSSGMVSPTSTSKVCSCGAKSGTCYKETHSHSYSCPSGYSASSSGMVSPTSTSKVCSCGAKSGTCYKETHSHSYSCTSGYSTSCSNGYSGTASKKCSCGATSGTCYKCNDLPAVNTKCRVGGYYDGTPCSGFAHYALGECGLKYNEMGADCSSRGQVGQGSCDVDSWRSCCEQCTGGA